MLSILGILIMVGGLLLVPLGFPGLWLMVGVLATGWWLGAVGWPVLAIALLLAAAAELVEYFIIHRMNVRYGGSRLAFWGAIFGGAAGAFVGMPVAIVGPVIAGFIGSFVGAALATLYQTRHVEAAARVGWGTLLGRMWTSAVKTGSGIVILVLGAAALLI